MVEFEGSWLEYQYPLAEDIGSGGRYSVAGGSDLEEIDRFPARPLHEIGESPVAVMNPSAETTVSREIPEENG